MKDEPRLAIAAILENRWTVINTHLSFVPLFNLVQLKRLKNWALRISRETKTTVVIAGDLNLPKNIPVAFSSWQSLVTANTYPSWGSKIQFDYLIAPKREKIQSQVRTFAPTGISDHLPIGVEL